MRVVNKISFEAKDDADALRLAGERLGKDAVILSTRKVRMGGFMGFFQRNVLMVSAGILQDDQQEEKIKDRDRDDAVARERLVAFQKLLEFKQATETATGVSSAGVADRQPARQKETGNGAKVIYSPQRIRGNEQEIDSVYLSREGLETVSRQSTPGEAVNPDNNSLREEVEELSKRLDTVLSHLDRTKKRAENVEPAQDRIFEAGLPAPEVTVPKYSRDIESDELYRKLLASEMEADYVQRMIEEYRSRSGGEPFEKWLASRIRCASSLPGDVMGGRKVMLLGPTGVGKTTTIAKLAAIHALWKHRNVLLMTSDTYRIAAVDQLRTYARILGVPIEVIFEAENFAEILKAHANAELILLDTAGRGPRDHKNLEAFKTLYDVFRPDAVHLVLAANMKYRDMRDVVERMSVVPISHVIFTKLDETISYGALFNVLQVLERPISFFTMGQNVPNDIEVASGARLASLLLGGENERHVP